VAGRRQRKDAYKHPWYKAQALKHARARWRAKQAARGRCTKCGRRRAVGHCDPCKDRHRAQQRAKWRRVQASHQCRGWATLKQRPTLRLLANGRVWTAATVAAAHGGGYRPAAAGKALAGLLRRRLVERTATGWRVTKAGRAETGRWGDGR
jgi:hypothetical protein